MDLTRTLTELECDDWGPSTHDSHVVTQRHKLRHVRLCDLIPEDLGLLTSQGVSLSLIVRLGLGVLVVNPFEECNFYPGDLLKGVSGVSSGFWAGHPHLAARWQAFQAQVGSHQAF
jgi:hypothetical protein